MKVTIKDVAKACNISIATVSHVINHTHPVSMETRARVEAKIEELGYVPNKSARGLKLGKKEIIGFIIPDISNHFFSAVAESMENELSKHGYNLIISSTKENLAQEISKLKFLTGITDGIILASCAQDYKQISPYLKKEVPVVLIDRFPKNCKKDTILIDTYTPLKEGVVDLLTSGHRKIGLVFNSLHLSTTLERVQAYEDAMKEFQITKYQDYLVAAGENHEKTKEVTIALLAKGCTAIVTVNNYMTSQIVSLLRLPKYQKRNIEVLGFRDYEDYITNDPLIHVVEQPSSKIGYLSAKQIIERIETPDKKHLHLTVDAKYLHRV